jgi:diketogulonate reductase-like aldo/keto reductase
MRAGKILSWGVSNFDVADLEEALAIAGEGRIACNQVLYHLHERAIEHEVIPWCERHGIAITAYSPFGNSRFPSSHNKRMSVLAGIAAARGATVRQVALAFLTRRASVFTIPKAARREHTEENAGASALDLTDAEIGRIDEAFPRGRSRSLPMT